MKNPIKFLLGIVIPLIPMNAIAQGDVAMADTMRSEGKIYVVVAIVLIILAGLFLYLFLLDRKIDRLEKEIKEN